MTRENVTVGKHGRKRQHLEDWELARTISKLMWDCDSLDLPGRCRAIAAAGHEARFLVGISQDEAAAALQDLAFGGDGAKERLFSIPGNVRKALQNRPAELKRRLADESRGLKSKYIYSSMLQEPDGSQGYLVFRLPRSNKCIVYMLSWDAPRRGCTSKISAKDFFGQH